MAIKLLDAVDLTSLPQLSATHKIGGTVKDHCIEVYITDANTGISAVTVDLQLKANNDSTTAFQTVVEHVFTAAQITALVAKINVLNEPATEVRVNISVATGAGAADTADVWYHPVPINK